MNKIQLLKRLDDLLGPMLCRVYSRPQKLTEYPAMDALDGGVLVIRPGGIGDAVMLLPMLTALRDAFPRRPIEVLCESRNHQVFAIADPSLTRLVYDRHPLSVLRRLRSARYAAVIDTEQFHHFSGVFSAWTRAPIRIGFKINTKRHGLYTHLVGYDLEGPEDLQFGRLLSALCGQPCALPPRQGLLRETRLPDHAPEWAGYLARTDGFAALHAGGSVTGKRWLPERYAALCASLTGRWGLLPVLLGGPGDRAYAAAVQAAVQAAGCPGVLDLCGMLSLPQTAALCRDARIFVGPDSGIAHLAGAVGTPSVVLFGPSDPRKWGPGASGLVVRHPMPCGPCAIFGYNKPCRTYACMERILPEAVADAVASVLRPGRGLGAAGDSPSPM